LQRGGSGTHSRLAVAIHEGAGRRPYRRSDGVNSALHVVERTGLILIYRCYFPVADDVLHEPVAVLEGIEVVNRFDRKALPVVERRTGAIRLKDLRILWPARCSVRRKDLGGGIVDVVTPGVGSDQLPAL